MSERDDWIPDDPGDTVLHAELGALLRAGAPQAPPRIEHRALGRIKAERDVLLIARTLGGVLLRVAAALPTYLPTRSVSGSRTNGTESRHTPGGTPDRGGDA